MFKRILTTTVVAALCCACGENEKSESAEHVHGPQCSSEQVAKVVEKAEHVHGEACSHDDDEESHEGHDHDSVEHAEHDVEHEHVDETVIEDKHDHSVAAANEVGEITIQGIKCDILRSCVASFFIKADKTLAADTQIRATIINTAGDESLKSKATVKNGLFSLNIEEAPAMDKGAKMIIEVTSGGKKETGTVIFK